MKFTHNGTDYELLVLTTSGSRLYGNSRPDSDWDYRGVFIASKESKLGLLGTVEQLEKRDVFNSLVNAGLKLEDTDDVVLYELNRFCALALDNNPNIMDILCHDYSNKEVNIYMNEKGKELLDAKDLFLSKKCKFTFSGYAISQLQRIKGHNKWINQFPDTDKVLRRLETRFKGGYIDFNWVCDNFGGKVAEKVTNETPQKNTRLVTTDTWEDFCTRYDDNDVDYNLYRLPRLVNYMKVYDLTHRELSLDSLVDDVVSFNAPKLTLLKFFETEASFRKFGESTLSVYTNGNGLFSKEGNLKSNDSEFLGEFVCLLSVNHNQYKADKDHLNKMWEWKCNRNEKRGTLEEKFGYDTKHASHLVRLMEGVEDLLNTCKYTPELSGERLKLVNDTRNGEFTYEEVLEYSERKDKWLDEVYKTSTLQNKPNTKKVNELVLKLQGC